MHRALLGSWHDHIRLLGSFTARVVQASIDEDGIVDATHVWCAVDCAQVFIVFDLSAALWGEFTFKDGRGEQTNFSALRAARQRGAAD